MRTLKILIAVAFSMLATISHAKSIIVSTSGSSVIEDMSPRHQEYRINISLPTRYESGDDEIKELFEGSYQTLVDFISKYSVYGSKIKSIQKDGAVVEGAKGMVKIAEAVQPRPALLISSFNQSIKIEIEDSMRLDPLKMRRFKDEAEAAIRGFLNASPMIKFWEGSADLPATNIPQTWLLSRKDQVIYNRSSELPDGMSEKYQSAYRKTTEKLLSEIESKCRSIMKDEKCNSEYADIQIEDELSYQDYEYHIEMSVKATYSSESDT